jgi:hypothetical protein
VSARPRAIADIVGAFNTAEDHAAFMRASAQLTDIPSAMMTDRDRADLFDAMKRALARLKTEWAR